MIEKLTKEQENQLEKYKDKWLKIGLSTDRFDFQTAKELSDYYYINFLHKNPVPVVILDSPLSSWIAVCMLSNMSASQVWSQVASQVRSQVESQVASQVRSQVESQVASQVASQVWSQVASQVRSQVESQVRSQVRSQVASQVESQVASQVASQVRSQVESQVRSQVRSQVASQVESQVASQVASQVRSYITPYIQGHLDSSYFSFFDFIDKVLSIEFDCKEKWEWYKKTTKIGNFYPLENICVISQKPIEINMTNGKLHADGKPAIKYADEFSVWSLNGVRVPQYLAETPAGNLDIDFFKKEKNADIKAEFIRKYGIERMISLGKQIDTWENHESATNFEWYKKSQYKIIDMSPIFTTYKYLPYLYMKNQSMPGTYHLECCYNPNGNQPKTILEGLKIRMSGVDPESVLISAIA